MDFETWSQLVLEERSRVKRIHMRAFIPAKKVGAIMGKRGIVQKELCQKYKAGLTFGDVQSVSGRVLHVEAESESMRGLWTNILHCMYKEEKEKNELLSDIGINFLLCDDFIGYLNEDNILCDIARTSNTKIAIKSESMPRSTEHIVRVSVRMLDNFHLNCFQSAVHLLSRQFELHPTIAYCMPGTKFYTIAERHSLEGIEMITKSNKHDIVYDFM